MFGENRRLRCTEGKSAVEYGAEYGSLRLWGYFPAGGSEDFVWINGLTRSLKYQMSAYEYLWLYESYTVICTEIFAGCQHEWLTQTVGPPSRHMIAQNNPWDSSYITLASFGRCPYPE